MSWTRLALVACMGMLLARMGCVEVVGATEV